MSLRPAMKRQGHGTSGWWLRDRDRELQIVVIVSIAKCVSHSLGQTLFMGGSKVIRALHCSVCVRS